MRVKHNQSTENVLGLLSAYESRNVTCIEDDGSWPIVWERAQGVYVWDAEGTRYLDLTAAFGVAAAGHANARIVRAGQQQMEKLLHAMGDVHPHAGKALLARQLSRLTYERWTASKTRKLTGKTIFCNSGFEAVEAALKTAFLATSRPGVLAFEGAYHGLGYGALNTTHREYFRSPFRRQLREFATFVPFPLADGISQDKAKLQETRRAIERQLERRKIGAILVEPIQARGGINIPPPGFLGMLRRVADEHGVLLICDEIYTGFGRTGAWFACEHARVIPDLICLGKALTGGFPLSACVGRTDLMDQAWPKSEGEALHTSTFLGHPVGCAMALESIREIARRNLPDRSKELGVYLLRELRLALEQAGVVGARIRGLGLLVGVDLRTPEGGPASDRALGIMKRMLKRGLIVLPEGEHGNVISFSPPLTINRAELKRTVIALTAAFLETKSTNSSRDPLPNR